MIEILLVLFVSSEWFQRYTKYRFMIKSIKKNSPYYYNKVRYLWWFDRKTLRAFISNLDEGQKINDAYTNALNRNKKLITGVTIGESQKRAQKILDEEVILMNKKYEENHKKN